MSVLLEEALKLPLDERRKLADDIYDSIVPGPDDLSLTDEQKTEIDCRLADYRENPDKALAWEDVRERLRRIA
jgi:putative addiction module component (TIGR02574 family)